MYDEHSEQKEPAYFVKCVENFVNGSYVRVVYDEQATYTFKSEDNNGWQQWRTPYKKLSEGLVDEL